MTIETIKKPLNYSFSYLAPTIEPDLVRIGNQHGDGGYVIPQIAIDRSQGLLSLGINFDWSFDEHWHKLKSADPIHSYDASVYPEMMPEDIRESYFDFFKDNAVHFKEMAGEKSFENTVPLSEMLRRIECDQVFLKMDIEGSEFIMIDDIVELSDSVTGIAVEFHHLCHLRPLFELAVRLLQSKYEIVHVHGNNGGTLRCCPDNIPDVVELTFLRKDLVRGNQKRKNFFLPELDASNMPGELDYELFLEKKEKI